jgi:hypothetical protein
MTELFNIMLAMLVECGLLLIAGIGVICVIFWIMNIISTANSNAQRTKNASQQHGP